MTFRSFLLAVALVAQADALLIQPSVKQLAPLRAARASPFMQFGGGKKPNTEPKGLTRDNEPEEFFATNMDDMSDAEKIRSPVVIGGLVLLKVTRPSHDLA